MRISAINNSALGTTNSVGVATCLQVSAGTESEGENRPGLLENLLGGTTRAPSVTGRLRIEWISGLISTHYGQNSCEKRVCSPGLTSDHKRDSRSHRNRRINKTCQVHLYRDAILIAICKRLLHSPLISHGAMDQSCKALLLCFKCPCTPL